MATVGWLALPAASLPQRPTGRRRPQASHSRPPGVQAPWPWVATASAVAIPSSSVEELDPAGRPLNEAEARGPRTASGSRTTPLSGAFEEGGDGVSGMARKR